MSKVIVSLLQSNFLASALILLRFVYSFAADYGPENLRFEDFRRRDRGDVPVKNDQVDEHTGFEFPLLLLGEFGKGRARGVSGGRLFDTDFLLPMIRILFLF